MTYSVVNPMLPYGNQSTITGLSSSGYFVGDCSVEVNSTYYDQAVLWLPNGTALSLQNPNPTVVSWSVNAINGSNESAGAAGGEAVVWSATGQPTVLDDPGGMGASYALAINGSGAVAGNSLVSSGVADAAYWAPSGVGTLLTSLGGQSDGIDLNDAGHICGYSNGEAVVWDTSGALVWSDNSGKASVAYAINANGETCGWDGRAAVIWSPTGVEKHLDRPLFGGVSEAVAINASGETCGYENAPSGHDTIAILWSPTGRATVLEKPQGGSAGARALNDRGDSVGFFSFAHGGTDAAYWGPKGKLTNLGRILGPTWSGTEATGINSNGDVVGRGMVGGLQESFFLLNTAPATATAPHFVESPIHHILAASAVPGESGI
jgi:hypothetical protein